MFSGGFHPIRERLRNSHIVEAGVFRPVGVYGLYGPQPDLAKGETSTELPIICEKL